MTAYDLLLLIATLCLVFLTAFACAALYYCMRLVQIWNKLSRETEQQIHHCVDRFQDALHSIASLKNIVEIGLQTFKAVGGAYAVSAKRRQSRKKTDSDE